MSKKYVKVMFGTVSRAGKQETSYKIGSINIAKIWNPEEKEASKMGGFNFSTEDKIIRWIFRGDTIYEVEIPKDAEMVEIDQEKGIFRTNKIILTNPEKITDQKALELYQKSNFKDRSYIKIMAGCAIAGHEKAARRIYEEKVKQQDGKMVWKEWIDFLTPEDGAFQEEMLEGIVKELHEKIKERR